MAANKEKKRLLRFPQDRTVGWVKVPKSIPAPLDPSDRWEMVGDATGNVAVPIDTPVRLVVEPYSARDLSWLQMLQPNDLTELSLAQTYLRDTALEHVAELTGLQTLVLSHPSGTISDTGMAYIQPLKQLRRLFLYATAVGDLGLSYLRGLTHLEVLGIGATNVTDAGLPFLYDLPSLREISFETAYSGGAECLVTNAGIALLKEALPSCVVVTDPL